MVLIGGETGTGKELLRIFDQKRIVSEHPELVERFSELKKRYS